MFDLAGIVIEIIQKDSYTMISNFRPYVLSLLYTLCMLDLILNKRRRKKKFIFYSMR